MFLQFFNEFWERWGDAAAFDTAALLRTPLVEPEALTPERHQRHRSQARLFSTPGSGMAILILEPYLLYEDVREHCALAQRSWARKPSLFQCFVNFSMSVGDAGVTLRLLILPRC